MTPSMRYNASPVRLPWLHYLRWGLLVLGVLIALTGRWAEQRELQSNGHGEVTAPKHETAAVIARSVATWQSM